jgi:hypothetical protein
MKFLVLLLLLGCAEGASPADSAPVGPVGGDASSDAGVMRGPDTRAADGAADSVTSSTDGPPPSDGGMSTPDGPVQMGDVFVPVDTQPAMGPCGCGGGYPNDAGQCQDPCPTQKAGTCCCGFRNQCQERGSIAECCRR